jgi:hypothetical protein
MNLQEQIGALESSVDQLTRLIQAALATPAAPAEPVLAAQATSENEPVAAHAEPADDHAGPAAQAAAGEPAAPPPDGQEAVPEPVDAKPALHVGRPAQNEIVLTIGGQSVSLRPEQVAQLIEELANARASMLPEPPMALPTGWRFVSTKNPVMAVQKQANGDRLLVLRHTGHGWVPYTFSPDMAIQLYMMLTQR